jgi:hypothetical protein
MVKFVQMENVWCLHVRRENFKDSFPRRCVEVYTISDSVLVVEKREGQITSPSLSSLTNAISLLAHYAKSGRGSRSR